MKRLLLTATLLSLAMVVGASAAQSVRIMADRVDVRSYSSPEAPVVGTLVKGTVLEVVAREGDWVRIAIPGTGYPGYVPLVYCQFVQGATPYTPAPAAAPMQAPPPPVVPVPAPAAPAVALPVVSAAPVTAPPPAESPPPATATATAASTPKVGLSVGEAYLYADWLSDAEFSGSVPFGLMLAANFNLNRFLGIVVDLAGHYKSEDCYISDCSLTIGSLHGGPRFSGHGTSSVPPYAQFLAGGTSYQVSVNGESGDTETYFSIQPGVGVIFRLSDVVGLEVGGDYRRVFGEDEGVNEFRAHVGVAFSLGSK